MHDCHNIWQLLTNKLQYELEKLLEVENDTSAGVQICLGFRVTLTFDLLTHKVYRFMSFPRSPLVLICIKIG